jgi:hypothetical protein
MKLYESRLAKYKENRERVLRGEINCIPFPFTRLRKEIPGIERAKYYCVSAGSKVGKSQLCDFLFVLSPLMYAFNNPDKIKLKIWYFSLEISVSEKMDLFTCFWLYYHTKSRIRVDPKLLNSLNETNPVSLEILELLESKEYQEFFDFIEDHVIFNETDRNSFGIYKTCVDYAKAHGKLLYKDVIFKDKETGIDTPGKIIDHYEPDDPLEYRIVITDHLSLLSPQRGEDLRQAIGKFSSNDCVQLRNIYGFTVVNVQQQASDKEGNDAFKLERLTPSPDGLADNKATQRDFNIMIGLFSPYRVKKSTWLGYNITDFEDHIRFLEVVLNRNGTSGIVCPLYFDGCCNWFQELPLPSETNQLEYFKQLIKRRQNE